jgi:hypothetical protein
VFSLAITKMATTTLDHPLIGSITGKSDCEDVKRYLGLQYATLTDRFAPPKAKEYSKCDTIDATSHGYVVLENRLYSLANYLDRPQVLAIPNGAEHEFKLLQHSLKYDSSAARMSDVDGLNLNVFAPASDEVSANGGLPVFVFIHGGGFNGGSSSYPPHDMTRFVRLSMVRGMPVIGVSLK